jgi:hypothetical protein
MKNLNAAEKTFEAVLKIDPTNSDAKAGIAELKRIEQASEAKSAKELRGFLSKGL